MIGKKAGRTRWLGCLIDVWPKSSFDLSWHYVTLQLNFVFLHCAYWEKELIDFDVRLSSGSDAHEEKEGTSSDDNNENQDNSKHYSGENQEQVPLLEFKLAKFLRGWLSNSRLWGLSRKGEEGGSAGTGFALHCLRGGPRDDDLSLMPTINGCKNWVGLLCKWLAVQALPLCFHFVLEGGLAACFISSTNMKFWVQGRHNSTWPKREGKQCLVECNVNVLFSVHLLLDVLWKASFIL